MFWWIGKAICYTQMFGVYGWQLKANRKHTEHLLAYRGRQDLGKKAGPNSLDTYLILEGTWLFGGLYSYEKYW